jgi:MGT family glycosyltransferase
MGCRAFPRRAETEIGLGHHIAFVNAPLTGEIYPTLAVVAELVRRGHRVTYAVPPERAEVVAAAGAQVLTYESVFPADDDPSVKRPDRMGFLPLVRESFLAEACSTLDQLDRLYAGDLPDVFCYRAHLLAPRILAARYGVRGVEMWPFLAANEHWSMGRHLGVALPPESDEMTAYRQQLDAYIASQLGGSLDAYTAAAPVRQIMFYPQSFQYRGETFGEPSTFVGPCIGARSWQAEWQPPAGDRPVLLVSLGTVYNRHLRFYRAALDAFADSPWHVELALGRRTDPAELGPIPGNVRVSASVPQLAVLAHASAFVTHAGMGSVMESLLHGCPMVTLPQTPEQEVNAERVVALGAGVRLDADAATADELRSAVEHVAADDQVAHRLGEIRREVQDCGGPALAASLIESAVAGR